MTEPLRNHRCRHYDRCLAEAARTDARTLPCPECPFKDDTGGKPDLSDLAGCLALLLAVFSPNGDRLNIRATIQTIDADLVNIIARIVGDRPPCDEFRLSL